MLLLNKVPINRTKIVNENISYNYALFTKNITKSKVILWLELKNKQVKNYTFKRQVPFYMYKLDFYCNNLKLVIEVEKNENRLKEKRLEYMGFNILKFTADDIFYDLENVLKTIEKYITNHEFKKRLYRN